MTTVIDKSSLEMKLKSADLACTNEIVESAITAGRS